MATDILDPNEGHRQAEEVFEEIETLQRRGGFEDWEDRRGAERLLNEAIELPGFEDRIRVVPQRSKGEPGWKRITIQRGKGERPLCNPYPVIAGGKRTAEEASKMFWDDFKNQIKQDTPQRRKMLELQSRLRNGERIELGCCGDQHCHGHLIREELIENWDPMDPRLTWLWDELDKPLPEVHDEPTEESSKPPHLLDMDGWVDDAHHLLEKYWGDHQSFGVEVLWVVKWDSELPPVTTFQAGAAAEAASHLLMKFDIAEKSSGRLAEDTFPEHMIRQLYASALRAHLHQDNGAYEKNELAEDFEKFKASIQLWRDFPLTRAMTVVTDDSGREIREEAISCPIRELAALRDWDRRGRPENDAPTVRINGQLVKADIGKMLQSGLEKIDISGLGGADLSSRLLNLAVTTGQPYSSIRKAWNEYVGGVLDREIFDSVLDEMLKGDEPMIGVDELTGDDFYKNVIVDFQRQFQCDPMLVLLTVMAAMGTVLPLETRVRGLSHTQHWRPGILFVMILVVSGGMKSMLLEELVEKPIAGGMVGADVKYYARRGRVALAALDKKDGESDPGFSGAPPWMQDWARSDAADFPEDHMHIVSDFTGEGIDRNAMNNYSFPGFRIGTLLTTDEGRQLMGGDRYKSGGKGSSGSKYTIDKLKRAWDGKGPASVRGNKALERNYDKIRLGVLAFIQPEVYDEIAGDETDDACGFWPRFLAYEAAPVQLRDDLTPLERRGLAANSTFRKYLDELYGSIYSLHLIPLHQKSQKVLFTFSEEAEDWWYPIQCQIGRESVRETGHGDGVMGRLLGKLPALVVDVSLLLHLLKLKGRNVLNTSRIDGVGGNRKQIQTMAMELEPHLTIPLETVQSAYTLCRQLMLRTARQRNRAQGDGTGDRAQFLLKVQATAMKLDPEQKGIPVGQLHKGWNGAYLKKHPETKDLIYQALGALSDRKLGELTLGTSNNGGGFRYRWLAPVTG